MAKLRHYSGTPVSEGVRVEVGKFTVFAVRNHERDISVRLRREPRRFLRFLFRFPFLRGIARLIRDVIRFFDGLSESAELNPHREAKDRGFVPALLGIAGTLALGFLCLYAAPLGAAQAVRMIPRLSRAGCNALACALRVFAVWAVVGLCGFLPGCRRLRRYRGALNKAINCYEHRNELTLENAREEDVIARRSEPAFLLMMLTLSMILCAFLHPMGLLTGALCRAAVFLGVTMVFNELLLWLETSEDNIGVRIVRAPLTLFQWMTAWEPEDAVLEVALCAMNAAQKAYEEEGAGK